MRLLVLAAFLASTAALAQQPPTVEGRVGKLEKEMRAVQRKVFPGGAEQFLEPEIRPAAPAAAPAGVPATGALNDLTARVDALEKQLQSVTGQAEQNGYRLKQLEDAVAKFRSDAEYRLGALEAGAPIASQPAPSGETPTPARRQPPPPPPPRGATPTPTFVDTAAETPPSSGDPAEDAYMAGYRLWSAKQYPEAEAALRAAAQRYPKHRRYSYSQNLLGRSYLDEGKPALAAEAFYANYRAMPRGERAPDSLYYLGQALTRLKKPVEACRVYDELRDVYGEKIAADLKAKVAVGRTDAKCGA